MKADVLTPLSFPLTVEELVYIVKRVAARHGRDPDLWTQEQLQQTVAGFVQCLTIMMELGWKIEAPRVRPPLL